MPSELSEVTHVAKNLYVISAAILIYLFAGADISRVALGGANVPAEYPVVFKGAALSVPLFGSGIAIT